MTFSRRRVPANDKVSLDRVPPTSMLILFLVGDSEKEGRNTFPTLVIQQLGALYTCSGRDRDVCSVVTTMTGRDLMTDRLNQHGSHRSFSLSLPSISNEYSIPAEKAHVEPPEIMTMTDLGGVLNRIQCISLEFGSSRYRSINGWCRPLSMAGRPSFPFNQPESQ